MTAIERHSSYLPWRLEIQGALELKSPLHIGAGTSSPLTDAPVLRINGKPFLPGTSLRGVLRHLLQSEASLLGCTVGDWLSLFSEATEDHPYQSRLTISSAFLEPDQTPVSETRDHVNIDRESGAAARTGKFDNEAILPGQGIFQFRAVYEGDGVEDPELSDY